MLPACFSILMRHSRDWEHKPVYICAQQLSKKRESTARVFPNSPKKLQEFQRIHAPFQRYMMIGQVKLSACDSSKDYRIVTGWHKLNLKDEGPLRMDIPSSKIRVNPYEIQLQYVKQGIQAIGIVVNINRKRTTNNQTNAKDLSLIAQHLCLQIKEA